MISIRRFILSTAFAALLSSCGHTGGTGYAALKNSPGLAPQKGKALVLVYRTPGMAGMVMKPFVWVNDHRLPGRLARGGFFSYDAAPGPIKVQFAWEDRYPGAGEVVGTAVVSGGLGVGMDYALRPSMMKKRETNLTVQSGQTCYVLMDGRRLVEMPPAKGQKQMAKCQWLNAPGSSNIAGEATQ